MSELKTYEMVDEKYCSDCFCVIPSEVYLKSEADKVIAELKNEIEEQKRLRNMALALVPNVLKVMKIIQHQKYKRCVAMAKMCCGKSTICMLGGHHDRKCFYNKWHLRWLELAEHYKEVK